MPVTVFFRENQTIDGTVVGQLTIEQGAEISEDHGLIVVRERAAGGYTGRTLAMFPVELIAGARVG